MELKTIILPFLLSFSLAAYSADGVPSSVTEIAEEGTAISGPTDEQEAMYSPSPEFEKYINGYVSKALSRQSSASKGSYSKLSSQVAKLNDSLKIINQRLDQEKADLQRCVDILTRFRKDIDTNYLYIKGIHKELSKVGLSIEDTQKNINQFNDATSALENKILNSKDEFRSLSSQIDGQVSKRLEDSSAFESRVYSISYVMITLAAIGIFAAIAAIVFSIFVFRRLGAVRGKYEELQKQVNEQKAPKHVISYETTNLDAKKPEVDHTFMLKLADDLLSMEGNLALLEKESDPYKNLQKTIERIRQSAEEKGYTFVNYQGQNYDPKMVCDAEFVYDENMEQGKSVIATMQRLQVNYMGKLLQRPKFIVRQNLAY